MWLIIRMKSWRKSHLCRAYTKGLAYDFYNRKSSELFSRYTVPVLLNINHII